MLCYVGNIGKQTTKQIAKSFFWHNKTNGNKTILEDKQRHNKNLSLEKQAPKCRNSKFSLQRRNDFSSEHILKRYRKLFSYAGARFLDILLLIDNLLFKEKEGINPQQFCLYLMKPWNTRKSLIQKLFRTELMPHTCKTALLITVRNSFP